MDNVPHDGNGDSGDEDSNAPVKEGNSESGLELVSYTLQQNEFERTNSNQYSLNGLQEKHQIIMPQTKQARKNQTKDIDAMFSDRHNVTFVFKDKTKKTLAGRWCNTCL